MIINVFFYVISNMKQEDKELLLKDLCARLPYGVKGAQVLGNTIWSEEPETIENIDLQKGKIWTDNTVQGYDIEAQDFKPYLRPMSSMTEEEFEELKSYSGLKYDQLDLAIFQNGTHKCLDFYLSEVPSYVVILVFDWLNSHYFDYRGFIEEGLALEAPKDMYKLTEK